MDSRIYPYLQEMFDAARQDGIYPVVREDYRTYEEQQKILDDKINTNLHEKIEMQKAKELLEKKELSD